MKKRETNGTALIEFALVLPLLVMILFGIVEFSLALYDKAMITNASREGARAGIVSQIPRVTPSEIEAVVNNYCQSFLISFGSNTPQTTVTPGLVFGDDLTVTVTYVYSFLVLPNLIQTLTGPIQLTATTIMKME